MVRPNSAVAFFCAEPAEEGKRILGAIRKAAYHQYRQVLEFEEVQWSPKGVGYAFVTDVWKDTTVEGADGVPASQQGDTPMEPADRKTRNWYQKQPSPAKGLTFLGLHISGGRYSPLINIGPTPVSWTVEVLGSGYRV